jgi:hypothetical protein
MAANLKGDIDEKDYSVGRVVVGGFGLCRTGLVSIAALAGWHRGCTCAVFHMEPRSSFDTAADCEISLTRHVDSREQRAKLKKGTPEELKINQRLLDRLTWARCIASDDPRLK